MDSTRHAQPAAHDRPLRRRARQPAKRPRTIRFDLTDDEFGEVSAAADRAGLAKGAFAAQATLAIARTGTTPSDSRSAKPSASSSAPLAWSAASASTSTRQSRSSTPPASAAATCSPSRPRASAAPSSSTRPPKKSGNGSASDRQGRPARQPRLRPDLLPLRTRPQRGAHRPAPRRRLAPPRRTRTPAPRRRPPRLPPPHRPAPAAHAPRSATAAFAKPVWHCSVRAAPGDRMLSDDEWAQLACDIMHRTGLAPYGQDDDAVRWVAVRHAADHIHLVAMLARQDGTRPRLWNDYYQVGEACRAAEQRFGLRRTAPRDRTAARRPTRAESEKAHRRGGRRLPASPSGGRSAPRPPGRPASRSSSPGWTGPGCWSASGSAPATPARSPGTPSRWPATPPGPVARCGSAAGSWPRT